MSDRSRRSRRSWFAALVSIHGRIGLSDEVTMVLSVLLVGVAVTVAPMAFAKKPPPTAAPPAAAESLPAIAIQTAAVIEGTVSDIQYEYTDAEGPWTVVTLSEVKAHMGVPPKSITIRQFGGKLPGDRMLTVAHLPRFVQGESYLLFLRNTAWNISPVVGGMAFRVARVHGAEVLVNLDGEAVTSIEPRGCRYTRRLFKQPDLSDPTAMKLQAGVEVSDVTQALDRAGFLEQLNLLLLEMNLIISGEFFDEPAGEFNWRNVKLTPASASPSQSTDSHDEGTAPEDDNPPQ